MKHAEKVFIAFQRLHDAKTYHVIGIKKPKMVYILVYEVEEMVEHITADEEGIELLKILNLEVCGTGG